MYLLNIIFIKNQSQRSRIKISRLLGNTLYIHNIYICNIYRASNRNRSFSAQDEFIDKANVAQMRLILEHWSKIAPRLVIVLKIDVLQCVCSGWAESCDHVRSQ